MTPVTMLVVGCGSRGTTYARYALAHPDRLRIIAVAEPREECRRCMAVEYGIPPENLFADWRELLNRPRCADAAMVATQDVLHAEPAIALMDRGYHLLLEKPMAPTAEACRRIAETAVRNRTIFGVCHVLRYMDYTRKLKELLDAGAVGDLVSIQHLEPLGYWHYAHSYVRGNWRNEALSSSMLLSKSCHDLDWLRYIFGVPCRRVSSFGSLKHFRPECRPPGAADHCLDCAVEGNCPYSAKRIYLRQVERSQSSWIGATTEADVLRGLRTLPYGRCVYACDNDVVDHQVVNMEFEGGRTATFTMTGFTRMGHRRTGIFGTRGEIYGDGSRIHVKDFLTDRTTVMELPATDGSIDGGHGGGDYRIMEAFVAAVATGDPGKILSGARESYETHLMVFAAETARHAGTVETIPDCTF